MKSYRCLFIQHEEDSGSAHGLTRMCVLPTFEMIFMKIKTIDIVPGILRLSLLLLLRKENY